MADTVALVLREVVRVCPVRKGNSFNFSDFLERRNVITYTYHRFTVANQAVAP